jgi:hypothetical protein
MSCITLGGQARGLDSASWDMVTDVVTWENQMIGAIANAGAGSHVLYHNLTSETPCVGIDSTWQKWRLETLKPMLLKRFYVSRR